MPVRADVGAGLPGGGQGVIDGIAVAAIFNTLMGCWALGFGIGKSVAWVRRIAGVA